MSNPDVADSILTAFSASQQTYCISPMSLIASHQMILFDCSGYDRCQVAFSNP